MNCTIPASAVLTGTHCPSSLVSSCISSILIISHAFRRSSSLSWGAQSFALNLHFHDCSPLSFHTHYHGLRICRVGSLDRAAAFFPRSIIHDAYVICSFMLSHRACLFRSSRISPRDAMSCKHGCSFRTELMGIVFVLLDIS
jgi:hypothetical protein